MTKNGKSPLRKSDVPADRRPHCPLADEIKLAAQVHNTCPLCGDSLFYKKSKNNIKIYEIAHIYPHSPTLHELWELASVKIPDNIDDEKNYIALCAKCHGIYDKSKTLAEYNKLLKIKEQCITEEQQKKLVYEYPLNDDIYKILEALCSLNETGEVELSLDPQKIRQKLSGASPLLVSKVQNYANEYFDFIHKRFSELKKCSRNVELVYQQVRTYYFAQQAMVDQTKESIFEHIVKWIVEKTRIENKIAAEIIVAYFIHDCEVFE